MPVFTIILREIANQYSVRCIREQLVPTTLHGKIQLDLLKKKFYTRTEVLRSAVGMIFYHPVRNPALW